MAWTVIDRRGFEDFHPTKDEDELVTEKSFDSYDEALRFIREHYDDVSADLLDSQVKNVGAGKVTVSDPDGGLPFAIRLVNNS